MYAAAGGVVVRDGQVLLLRRPSRAEIRLPKGHVEPGESHEAAALREAREEGGMANPRLVADLGLQQVEFDHDGVHWIRLEFYYLMALDDLTPFPRSAEDEAEFQPFWVPIADAESLLTFPSEREWLRRARQALESGDEVTVQTFT
jgi:8-oxo-dGTP pyrophosphatase MutT (NUDIX family)